MQQLWRINMATAKCVETTGESHVHFAKHSPGEMKTRPSRAQNITTTRNQTPAMNCHTYIVPLTMEWRSASCLWRLQLPTPVGLLCQFQCRLHQTHRCCCVSFNVVRIKPIDVCFLIFARRSPCQQISLYYQLTLYRTYKVISTAQNLKPISKHTMFLAPGQQCISVTFYLLLSNGHSIGFCVWVKNKFCKHLHLSKDGCI